MIRPDATFSYAALFESGCTHWLQDGVPWQRSTSAYSEGGTAVHHPLAVLVNGGTLELPADPMLREMYGHGKAWLDANRVAGMRAEVAFAYDTETRTGRELVDPGAMRHQNPRWYADEALRTAHGIRPSEVCGRVDLVCMGIDEDGAFASVIDYKCHFGPDHEDARAQLAMGALAVARAYDIDRVKVRAVHLMADRAPYIEAYALDAFDLDSVAVMLDALAYPLPANDPVPVPGAHCKARRCPARTSCALGAEIVAEAIVVPGLVPDAALVRKHSPHPFLAKIESNDQAAWTLVALDLLKEILEAKKSEVKAFAETSGGIRQSDGKIYGKRGSRFAARRAS